jgi:hypothetical protein
MVYKKFQFGWVIVVIFMVIMVWMTFAYIYQWGSNPIDKFGYIFMTLLLGAFMLVFCGMTVIVTDRHIKIKLGIGFLVKKVDLQSVSSVEIVQVPLLYGYGIRIIPGGTLYNVSGKYAVMIRFKDRKRILQIGTNDRENLKIAIESRISKF